MNEFVYVRSISNYSNPPVEFPQTHHQGMRLRELDDWWTTRAQQQTTGLDTEQFIARCLGELKATMANAKQLVKGATSVKDMRVNILSDYVKHCQDGGFKRKTFVGLKRKEDGTRVEEAYYVNVTSGTFNEDSLRKYFESEFAKLFQVSESEFFEKCKVMLKASMKAASTRVKGGTQRMSCTMSYLIDYYVRACRGEITSNSSLLPTSRFKREAANFDKERYFTVSPSGTKTTWDDSVQGKELQTLFEQRLEDLFDKELKGRNFIYAGKE